MTDVDLRRVLLNRPLSQQPVLELLQHLLRIRPVMLVTLRHLIFRDLRQAIGVITQSDQANRDGAQKRYANRRIPIRSAPCSGTVECMPLALVTGAARANSIAAGIVPRLVSDGWEVATSDLHDVDYACDLSLPTAPDELISAVTNDRGPISALILSHAHDIESGILDTTANSFDAHVAVNARASLLLIAAFARQVPEEGGTVLALTSDHTTSNLPYGASKGALDRIVISAARELGSKRISANVVNPGPIDTGWMDDALRSELTPAHPLGRLGTPADIAAIIAFLISDEGRWISGQLINADGGFSARF